MAKSKKAKINLPINDTKTITLSSVDSNKLPVYAHFVDSLNHTFRFFFEDPRNNEEVNDVKYPNKKYSGAGSHLNKGAKASFLIVRDGTKLVGESIAKEFARLMIKRIASRELSSSIISNNKDSIKLFFNFLASLTAPPIHFNEITTMHFSNWLNSLEVNKGRRCKGSIKTVIDLHPIKNIDLSKIQISDKKKIERDLNQVDFDKIVGETDYSDKEIMQLLAYAFYEIEESQKLFHILKTSTLEDLADDYIPIRNCTSKNLKIAELLECGNDGHQKLFKHINILIANEANGIIDCASISNHNSFMVKLRSYGDVVYNKKENPFLYFTKHLKSYCWPLGKKSNYSSIQYPERLQLKSNHHEIAILLYTLIITGLNLETVMSWKRNVNGKPWFENYDVDLGISEKSSPSDKSIVLVGNKKKGRGAVKLITTSLSVNSPIFKYLKFLDDTRPITRDYIFSIKSSIKNNFVAFCNHYPIFDEEGNRILSIETRRIRKVFAGHQLIKLLKDVKSADELVVKLKDALRHEKFDTTLFSYILKSGVGNLVINSAIVALTSDLLEKAITFQGEIKDDSERSESVSKVYLCDCTDPTNPSHGLPISDRCRKYDMCLGCKRSEVYTEHLPSICYRIMQYENKRVSELEEFKALLEDRLYIARDTIEQFKIRHKNGDALVEQAYLQANEAMANDLPLLPEILQVGGI